MNGITVFVIAAVSAVLTSVAVTLALSARRRRRQRTVERPNSHYTSPLVRGRETHDRWRSMALDHVHEINQEEVVRLLGKMDALGRDSLTPAERTFLERIAGIGNPSPPP